MEREILVSVDLGNSRIRMMAAERQEDKRLKVLWLDSKETADESVQNGIIKKPADVANVLRESAEQIEAHLGNRYAVDGFYLGINGRSLRTIRGCVKRTFQSSSEITAEELAALKKELYAKPIDGREIFNIKNVGFVTDGDRVRNPNGRVCRRIEANYLIACANKDVRDNIDKCVERLGLEVKGEKLAPEAIADAVLTADDKKVGCAVINFGAATTTVAVYHDGYLQHIAVVPFGGNHITSDIMSLDLDCKTAERIKTQYVKKALSADVNLNSSLIIKDNYGNEHKVQVKDVVELVDARLSEIIALCLSEIEHSQHRNDLKAGIVVTGGVSNMEDFEKYVAQKTGMLVRKGSHAHHLSDDSVANNSKPELALLVGLLVDADRQCMSEKTIRKQPEQALPEENENTDAGSREVADKEKTENSDNRKNVKRDKKGNGLGGLFDRIFYDKEGTIED